MEITTWSDVRAEMARSGFQQQQVAAQMGYRADEFSRLINPEDSIPTPAWIQRFEAALEAMSREGAKR